MRRFTSFACNFELNLKPSSLIRRKNDWSESKKRNRNRYKETKKEKKMPIVLEGP